MSGRKRRGEEGEEIAAIGGNKRAKGRRDNVNDNHLIEEKRATRTRSSANRDTCQRIERALSQRLYLLNQSDISTTNRLCRTYDVLGSTGNVYQVEISQFPSCTCPDAERGNLCKHILFVYLRVLRCQSNSKIIIQKSLLQNELALIFGPRGTATSSQKVSSDVQASKEIMRVYSNSINGSQNIISLVDSESEVKNEDDTSEAPAEKAPDGECPICFESMDTKESLNRCGTCRNYIHSDCLRRWLTQSKTCVYCRSAWAAPTGDTKSSHISLSQVGGYLNIS
jgi:hypothetical protein